MAAKKNRTCQVCTTRFKGRGDAKTCSPTCRKRLQRQVRAEIADKTARLESRLGQEFHRLAGELFQSHVTFHKPLVLADERGSIAVATPPAPHKPLAAAPRLESDIVPAVETIPLAAPPSDEAASTEGSEVASDSGEPIAVRTVALPDTGSKGAGVSAGINAGAGLEEESLELPDAVAEMSSGAGGTGGGELDATEPVTGGLHGAGDGSGSRGKREKGFSVLRYNKFAFLVTGLAVVVIFLIAAIGMAFLGHRGSNNTGSSVARNVDNYNNGGLPLSNVKSNDQLSIGQASTLSVNGQLKVSNTLVLTPTSRPAAPLKGQIYYDQTTNVPYFYNGSQFVSLSPQGVSSIGGSSGAIAVGNGLSVVNNQLGLTNSILQQINSVSRGGVSSVQGQTGAVSFGAGQGIFINGTTIGNSGVLNLTGTANQVSVSAGTGNITLSLPQNIGTASAPTFGGLTVNGTLSVTTLQQTVAGNNLNISAGSNNISFTANGRTFVLPNTGPSSQTICTTGYTCATGPGTAVELQPVTVQADSGSGPSIFINNTGGGDLLQLQGSGNNVFVVSNGGNVTAAGTLSVQGSNLSVGTSSVGGSITVQDGAGHTGTLQLGTTLPGNVTYNLPTPLVAGTQTICTVELGNCAGSGSGVTTPGGIAGYLPVFTATQSIADSIVSQSGSTLTTAGNMVVNAANGFAGNLLNLEVNSSSKLSVDQAGNTIQAGTLTVNGTGTSSIAGSLSVGTGLTVTTGGANITGTTAVTGNATITGTLAVEGANALTLGTALGNTGEILFHGSGGNGVLTLAGPTTPSIGNYTISLPAVAADDTICTNSTQATACPNYAPASGSGSYINNGTAPQTADFNITGTGTAGSLSATTLSGNGSGVTNLNGSHIASGTIANTYLTGSGALTVAAGTGLNGGGSVALGGTTTLNVTYGSAAGSAVQGNTTLTCASGSGNLSGGGNVITLGTGGSCNAISITNSPTFSGTLSVQGAGGIVVGTASAAGIITLNDGTGNTGILQLAGGLPGGVTYNLPVPLTAGTQTICTVELGNCAGSGSGVTTPGGTIGYLPVFTGSQSVADSVVSQSGTALNVAGTLTVTGSSSLTLGTALGNTGAVTLYNSTNGHYLTLQSGATAADLTLTLPTADGSNGQCLQTDGSGNLSFNDCTGGAAGGVNTLDGLAGSLTLANSSGAGATITIDNAKADGSTKGISAFNSTNFSDNGSGVINTVQNIDTGANPVFASVNGTSGINTGAGAGTQRLDASGNLVNIGTVATSGAINGQTIGSLSVFTGTVAIQGSNALALGASGTAGSIAFHNGAGSHVITLQGPATDPASDYTLSIPTLTGDDTICVATLANCTAAGGAGGDLSGSYPDPTVVGIQGNPVVFTSLSAGDVLQYDGSNIVNGHITNSNLATGNFGNIQGVGTLTNGQISTGFGAISTGNNITTTATLHGDTLTAGSANQFQVDASGNLTIANAAAVQGANGLTLGVSGPSGTDGLLSFANTTNTNLTVISADAPTGTSNATITIPSIAGGTSDTFCLVSLGNCAGSGSSVTVSSPGTNGTIAMFTGSQTIANSILSQSGTTLTNAGNLVVNAASGFIGNLINLEVNSSSKLSVDESGNSIQAGTLTVNGTGASSIAGTLSVGTLGTLGTTVLCSNAGVLSSCSSTAGAGNFILNGTSPQTADFNITGTGTVGGITIGSTCSIASSTSICFGNGINLYNYNAGTALATDGEFSAHDLYAVGSLSFGTFNETTFITPTGAHVDTKINIPLYDPGAFNQLIALGLPSGSATSARAITVFDARTTTNNQPPLAVISPDESNIFGLSWEGASTTGYLKVGSGGAIDLRSGSNDLANWNSGGAAIFKTSSTDVTNALQLWNHSNQEYLQADSLNGRLGVGLLAAPANSVLTVGTSTTTASGGITFGTDTSANLYRSGTGQLKTDGSFVVAPTGGSATALQVNNGATNYLTVNTSSGAFNVGNTSSGPYVQGTCGVPVCKVHIGDGAGDTINLDSATGSSIDVGTGTLGLTSSNISIGQTGFLNVSGGYEINGVNINTGGTLSDVAYLDQANTFTQAQTINKNSATALQVQDGSAGSVFTVDSSNAAARAVLGGANKGDSILQFQRSGTNTYSIGSDSNSLGGADGLFIYNDAGSGAYVAAFRNNGAVAFQNSTDSAAGFQIQKAGTGGTLFNVDTSGNGLYIGATGASTNASTVHIADQTNGSGNQTVSIGSTNGSSTTLIQGGTPGSGAAISLVAGGAGIAIGTNSTAHEIDINNTTGASKTVISSGTGGISLNPSGTSNTGVTVKPGTDSTAAFQIQNALGTNTLFAADTANSRLTVSGSVNVGTLGGNRLFSDGFESGNFSLWSGGANGSPSISTSTVYDGKYSAQINPGGVAQTEDVNFPSQQPTVYVGAWVYVSSQTSTKAYLLNTEDANSYYEWDVYRTTDGKVHLVNGLAGTTLDSTTAPLTTGGWHYVQERVTIGSGTGISQVWVDGTQVINGTGQNNGTVNLGDMFIGDYHGDTFNAYFDDVTIDTSQITTPYSGLNVDDSLHVGGTASFGSNLSVLQGANIYFGTNASIGENSATNLVLTETSGGTYIQSHILQFQDNYNGYANEFTIQNAGQATFQNYSNSAAAFQIQKAGSGGTLFNADTQNSVVTVTAGTDSSTLGSSLFTSAFSGTGWTKTGTGASATGTHTSGTTALTAPVSISSGNRYFVSWTVTNPNAGSTLVITMGGQTLATYSFDSLTGGTYSFGDSNTILASSTANLQFTPSSSFTGEISNVSVQLMTYNSAPALVVDNTTGNPSLEVRPSSDAGTLFMGYNAGTQNNPNDGAYGNTGVGSWALQYNVNGARNAAFGTGALESNSSGDDNVALGYNALQANTSGFSNVAIGSGALQSEVWGATNIAIGNSALATTVSGYDNVGIGNAALASVTSNYGLVAIGSGSGGSITTGGGNTSVGYGTLRDDVTGYNNTALGQFALQHVLGNENIGVGLQALAGTTSGSQNTVVGTYALSGNSAGNGNTILGYSAGNNLASGDGNILLGYEAGFNLTSGSNNVLIGANAPNATGSNQLDIGNAIYGDLSTGAIKLQNGTNTTTAFQILQATTNASLFTADTSNMRIQIGSAGTPVSQLFVSGSAPSSAVGSVSVGGTGPGVQDIRVSGNYGYAIDYNNSKLYTLDLSNPASPTILNTAGTGTATSAGPQALYVAGHYLYVGDFNASKLEIFDISNPKAPSLVGSLGSTGQVQSIYVSGNYAYVGTNSGKLIVVDVSNPTNPSLVATVTTNNVGSVFVSGSYLYEVDTGGTFRIFNISNPASPVAAGTIATGGAPACTGGIISPQNVYVSGKYAYVTVCTTNTVKIFDISNPASPSAVGSGISTGSSTGPIAVNVQGRYAYVALYNSSAMATYDVSNPASPVAIGTTSTGASSGPDALGVQGRYAYVGDLDDGKVNVLDLGGAYVQQLESGNEQTGALTVTGNSNTVGDSNVQGSLQVGQNVAINGNLGVGGQALFKNSSNSTTAFQIQNSVGASLFTADTSGMNIIMQGGYSGETSAWASTVSTGLPAREGNSSVIANGYIYMIAGYNSGAQSDVYYAKLNANGTTGSWTATTSMPTPLDGNRATFSNGYIYVFSGQGGTGARNVYYTKPNADGTISSWTTLSTVLPSAQRDTAAPAANNGYIYWIGGDNGTATSAVSYARQNPDGSLGTFTSTSSLPAARTGIQAVVSNGYVYVFGGYDDSGISQSTVYKAQINANGTLGTWSSTGLASMPSPRHQYTAALVNGYVYIMGGIQASNINGSPTNTVFYAHINSDGTISSWNTSTHTLPDNLRWVYGGTANGYLYTVNGDDGSPTAAVYYTSVSRVQIAGSLDLVGINGGNLANPGSGGSLTAGDTTIAGTLQVSGQANFSQGVNINGIVTIGAGASNATLANSQAALFVGTNGTRSINASGTINASGADYSEYIPWSGTVPDPGTIVEYNGSTFVVSSQQTAAFVGNDVLGGQESIMVAFAGQVPTKVTGAVNVGDILVDNGDGTAKAVSPSNATIADYLGKLGIAEESSTDTGVKLIKAAIGTTGANVTANPQQSSSNFSDINVSGTATINTLTVTGSANIADATIGTLTVTSSARFAGNITIGGHIITAGGEPTSQAQVAAGGSASVSVDGTDTTGTITITTGSNPTAGELAKILFSATYDNAPHIVLSPSNNKAAALQFYKGATSATDFMLDAIDAPQANTTYQFDYFIAQ